ncbi:DUF2835 domain-containing protein [Thalassotalea sp. G2M2-11]|uniref:DUF2835 domain-containing protein n=1 Tax=Thalassotalea sp. G2M2-11 TaxID=2787627 RepID=UPI0019D15DD1|nr:DUF2835 domain-containing protein [Thalassotalea sp. G2M2-11]
MKYYFSINMSTQQYLPYYQGKVHSIVVTSNHGKRIQFPAMHLRKFLTSTGVSGFFCLETENNKFKSLHRISD